MKDRMQRTIDYLRISVTDRCNLRCVYCMPEDGIASVPHEQILTFDEIHRICHIMAEHGLQKVKITGGEPLVRKGVLSLIRDIKQIPGIRQVTLTTNGVLLAEYAEGLKEAGIDGVTVSLDTLDRKKFQEIARRDALAEVLAGIRAMEAWPDIPLKLNCLLQGEEADLLALAGIARERRIHMRFIETMPIGSGRDMPFYGEAYLRKILENTFGPMTPYKQGLGNGPAVYYELPGFQGKIGLISALSHPFCHRCNRVRLTSEGFLKTCLQYDAGIDLRMPMRNGIGREELEALILHAIEEKPASHCFTQMEAGEEVDSRSMSQIGG